MPKLTPKVYLSCDFIDFLLTGFSLWFHQNCHMQAATPDSETFAKNDSARLFRDQTLYS